MFTQVMVKTQSVLEVRKGNRNWMGREGMWDGSEGTGGGEKGKKKYPLVTNLAL